MTRRPTACSPAPSSAFRDDNGTPGLQQSGASADSVSGTCTTVANGRCSVPDAALPASLDWGYDYYWVETVPPPGYNLPTVVVNGPISITKANAGTTFPVTVFGDTQSAITTSASEQLSCRAPRSPTGDALRRPGQRAGHHRVQGVRAGHRPEPATDVHGEQPRVHVRARRRYGAGTYGPVSYPPLLAGSYYWIASYSGDPAHQVPGMSGILRRHR